MKHMVKRSETTVKRWGFRG